jgi:hypothetical protein
MLDSIRGFSYIFISSALHSGSGWNVLSAFKRKKVLIFFPRIQHCPVLLKKRQKKKILAQVYIVNGYGIDSQVSNSSYIKVVTAT